MTTRKKDRPPRDMTFADRVRVARIELGWTQRALGAKVKMSQSEIAALEDGRPPMLATAVKFAKELRVTVDWLAGRVGVRGPGGPFTDT